MDYVRLSASYLFNIEIDGKYLLIKSERRNQYQPIGGCYKYYLESEDFLNTLGAIPEKKSNGVESLMDLRLMVPKQNVDELLAWYVSGIGRETTYDREFGEELLSLLTQEQQAKFGKVDMCKQASGSFDIYFDKEKGIETIKPMDIVAVNLNAEQKEIIKRLCLKNKINVMLATGEDILKGTKKNADGTTVKIGDHTKNILPVVQPQYGD